MDLVQLDDISPCCRGAIPPGPPDRKGGIIEIMDAIVDDPVPGALPDPYTDRAVKKESALSYFAVCHNIVACIHRAVARDLRLPYFDPPPTQVCKRALSHSVTHAPGAKGKPIGAQTREGTFFKHGIAQTDSFDCSRETYRRLNETA
jgi:hypothetical protein